jgi:hypothetical protein
MKRLSYNLYVRSYCIYHIYRHIVKNNIVTRWNSRIAKLIKLAKFGVGFIGIALADVSIVG